MLTENDTTPEKLRYTFAPTNGEEGVEDLSEDPRLALLAVSVANQQKAGFGPYLDLRQAHCPHCEAPGFNTGWGFWQFTCGLELLAGDEGIEDEPCGKVAAAEPDEAGE